MKNMMPKLQKGARVALVAPSGPTKADSLAMAVNAVQAKGLEPVVYDSCRSTHGYFAGEDALRAQDLQSAFLDPAIDGILCLRGGYGMQRILPLLNIPAMAATGKWFGGYSDITALHTPLNALGLTTYLCPMPSTDWGDMDESTDISLEQALFGTQTVLQNPPAFPHRALHGGKAVGRLCGGCLSLLTSSLGTPYALHPEGGILFLEDVDEAYYSIDRMLTHLRNAGVLQACNGIVLGHWADCTQKNDPGLPLETVLEELLLPLGKPILSGFCCGHKHPTLTLPLGECAELDADAGTITILEDNP